jgi:hypothetical protein
MRLGLLCVAGWGVLAALRGVQASRHLTSTTNATRGIYYGEHLP